jgi:hypothetical protein
VVQCSIGEIKHRHIEILGIHWWEIQKISVVGDGKLYNLLEEFLHQYNMLLTIF